MTNADRDLATIRDLIGSGRYVEALLACNELLRREPSNLEAVLQKAWLLASPMPEVSDPEEGIALIRKALVTSPSSPALHVALANMYASGLGEYGAAVGEYKYAIELGPDDGRAYLELALLLGAPGAQLSAEEVAGYLERGVSMVPGDWQLRRELALLCWRRSDFPRAEQEFVSALACEPPPTLESRQQIMSWLARVRGGAAFELSTSAR